MNMTEPGTLVTARGRPWLIAVAVVALAAALLSLAMLRGATASTALTPAATSQTATSQTAAPMAAEPAGGGGHDHGSPPPSEDDGGHDDHGSPPPSEEDDEDEYDGGGHDDHGSEPSESPDSSEPSEPGSSCTSAAFADAFLGHIRASHLQQSPSQQVAAILDFDAWILHHTLWIDGFLTPLLASDATGKEMISVIWTHFDAHHLQESPGAQAGHILELDSWLESHTEWISTVLTPTVQQATC